MRGDKPQKPVWSRGDHRVISPQESWMALHEGACDETPFEGLCFPLSMRNWHFVTKMAQRSFLWSSAYGKTAGPCRQRKFSCRSLSLDKRFRSNEIEEMGFYRTSLLYGQNAAQFAPGGRRH